MLFIDPQVAVFYMLYLLINDHRANDQGDGDGKLGYHEPFTDKTCAGIQPDPLSFQNCRRLEGRKIEGGIAAGHQPTEYTDSEHAGKMRRSEEIEDQVLVKYGVETRQEHINQSDSQRYGDKRHDQRFEDRLADQRLSQRAEGLSHSDLPGTLTGPGRGEVHEVDTGDDQDDPGNSGKKSYISDAAAVGLAVCIVRIQMPVIHRPQQAVSIGIQRGFRAKDRRQLSVDPVDIGNRLQF